MLYEKYKHRSYRLVIFSLLLCTTLLSINCVSNDGLLEPSFALAVHANDLIPCWVGTRIVNNSSQPIVLTVTRQSPPGSGQCVSAVITLEANRTSEWDQDVEAVWSRCDTEPGCENGRRPFKIAGCLPPIQQCTSVVGEGLALFIKGTSECPIKAGFPSWKCGWVDRNTGWPDPNKATETGAVWAEPPVGIIRYYLNASQWSCNPSERCLPIRATVCPDITSWKGEYWNSIDQTFNGSATLCRNDNEINFDWGSGSPGVGVSGDNFTARWTKRTNFNAGTYNFTAVADDGIRVYLDNTPIINEWRGQPPTTFQKTVFVSGGEHTIKVEYFEGGGGAVARLNWQLLQGQGGCPAISAWKGEYWSGYFNGSPSLCRNDNDLNFDWGGGSPGPGIPSDNFTARWTRTLNFNGGRYRFHLAGDDGFSLRIDDRVVIDKWISQARTEYTADIDLSGDNHTIKVEYFEGGGQASIALWWETIAGSPPGGGGSIDTNKVYRIIAVHSGKGLDVSGASQDNGATIHQWTYAGGANQRWRFESTGDGYYMIRAVHSNKCLDVEAASPNNGAKVHQWACAAGNNQRWQVSADGNAFVIRAKHSGKALDVKGADQTNGAGVTQWDYGGGANQRWLIEAVQ